MSVPYHTAVQGEMRAYIDPSNGHQRKRIKRGFNWLFEGDEVWAAGRDQGRLWETEEIWAGLWRIRISLSRGSEKGIRMNSIHSFFPEILFEEMGKGMNQNNTIPSLSIFECLLCADHCSKCSDRAMIKTESLFSEHIQSSELIKCATFFPLFHHHNHLPYFLLY